MRRITAGSLPGNYRIIAGSLPDHCRAITGSLHASLHALFHALFHAFVVFAGHILKRTAFRFLDNLAHK